jgi:hypothetical protein
MIKLTSTTWRKSRRSQDNGACVEVAHLGSTVGLRDSKDPMGPVLLFRKEEFAAFLDSAAKGEFTNMT